MENHDYYLVNRNNVKGKTVKGANHTIPKLTKQIKWICPNRCGSFRMLNGGGAKPATLALCHNPACEFTMMIPENQKMKLLRREKVEDEKKKKRYVCSQCGKNPGNLTAISKKINLCYNCLKNFPGVPQWKKKEENLIKIKDSNVKLFDLNEREYNIDALTIKPNNWSKR